MDLPSPIRRMRCEESKGMVGDCCLWRVILDFAFGFGFGALCALGLAACLRKGLDGALCLFI